VVFVASSLVSTAAAGGALSAAGEARPFSPDMVLSSRGGDGAVMSAHATGGGGWTGAGDWRWCGWCRVVSVCGIVLGFWVWLGRLVQNGKSQLATRSSRAEWAAGCVRDSHRCGLRVEWLMTMRGSGVERPCAQDGRWWCCDGNGDGTGCDAMAMADRGGGGGRWKWMMMDGPRSMRTRDTMQGEVAPSGGRERSCFAKRNYLPRAHDDGLVRAPWTGNEERGNEGASLVGLDLLGLEACSWSAWSWSDRVRPGQAHSVFALLEWSACLQWHGEESNQ